MRSTPSAVHQTGVGAKFDWAGNKDVGSGSQEIVAAKANESLKLQLDFGDMGRPTAEFHLSPAGQGTKVTWTLDQSFEGSLVGRYFGLMMDSMVGKDYEKGLAKLKTLVETFPAADISGVNGEAVDLAAQKIYYVSGGPVTDDASAKAATRLPHIVEIGQFLAANKLAMESAPLTITNSYDKTVGWKFDAAITVVENDVAPAGISRRGRPTRERRSSSRMSAATTRSATRSAKGLCVARRHGA